MRGNPNAAILRLKEAGYYVETEFLRLTEESAESERASREGRRTVRYRWDDRQPRSMSAKGGTVRVKISRRVGKVPAGAPPLLALVAVGVSHCSPYDNFNKSLGMRIALGRAIDKDSRLHDIAVSERPRLVQRMACFAPCPDSLAGRPCACSRVNA